MTIHQTITQNKTLSSLMPTKEAGKSEQNEGLSQLIEGCLNGRRQAQMKLYQQFYNQIFAVCLRYANDRNEAKSLVNTAFLKVFNYLNTYQASGAFGAWLTRIAINTCIDEVRKRTKTLQHVVTTGELPEPVIPNDLIDRLAAEDILTAIRKVSPLSRTVFCLYVIDGYKHAEIAEMLEIQEVTSRWHLSNAKKELQALLSDYEK